MELLKEERKVNSAPLFYSIADRGGKKKGEKGEIVYSLRIGGGKKRRTARPSPSAALREGEETSVKLPASSNVRTGRRGRHV